MVICFDSSSQMTLVLSSSTPNSWVHFCCLIQYVLYFTQGTLFSCSIIHAFNQNTEYLLKSKVRWNWVIHPHPYLTLQSISVKCFNYFSLSPASGSAKNDGRALGYVYERDTFFAICSVRCLSWYECLISKMLTISDC